jgi:transposase
MQVVFERCAGADVHKDSVVVCVLVPGPGGTRKETRTFGTASRELVKLSDWLHSERVTHLAMESTGVYWKPVYNLLEGTLQVWLVNAQHVKNVPGRKTDVEDAEWIAQLLRHGLVKPSFIPPADIRELREYTRYRRTLVHTRSDEVNRLQKLLEGANIKLASVVTDVLGVSARAMLEAMAGGQTDAEALADLARGKLKSKREELVLALEGRIRDYHRFLLRQLLDHIAFLDRTIEQVSGKIEEALRPFADLVQRLCEHPGVGRRTVEDVLAEIGTDMSRFPSDAHIASWAGLCPGNNQSAGKRKSGRTRKANPWLRAALVESAKSAARTKGSHFQAQYARLKARRGGKKAIVAVAHSILVNFYHMIRQGTSYRELGADHFDRRNKEIVCRRLVRRLRQMGYQVQVTEGAA